MLDQLKALFGQNEFLSGGFILMILGSIVAFCRNLPSTLWRIVRRQFMLSLEMRNDELIFFWFEEWLARRVGEKYRDFTVNDKFQFSPAPGTHFVWYKGRVMRIHRNRNEQSHRSVESMGFAGKAPETFVVEFLFCRDRSIIRSLMNEIRLIKETDKDDNLVVFTMGNHGWSSRTAPKRPKASVISPDVDRIISSCRWFFDNKEWYLQRGVPHRRGYLLHGPPGNGKTSIIRAVATELRVPVFVASIGSVSGDAELISLIRDVDNPCILVIEDVDCINVNRSEAAKTDGKGVTFSGLLNALDGIQSSENRVLFLTTNKPLVLDEALMRPGRVDEKVFVGNATKDQGMEMYTRFFGDTLPEHLGPFIDSIDGSKSMAQLQETLLTLNRNLPAPLTP